jgi:hypothetical protein
MLNKGSTAEPFVPYFSADERYAKKTDLELAKAVASITCAFDFSEWNKATTTKRYSSAEEMKMINLEYISANGNTHNEVFVMPLGAGESITKISINYLRGDDGYIAFNLKSLGSDTITFSAKNISSGSIYSNGYSLTNSVSKSTTFKLIVEDMYENVYAKEFTVNYKINGNV